MDSSSRSARHRTVRLSPTGIAIACAVISALSAIGTIAYASIGTSGISNGSILSIDVRDGSLRGRDVRNGSLTGLDIAPETADFTRAYAKGRTGTVAVGDNDGLQVARALPAGHYTLVATARVSNNNLQTATNPGCELSTGPGFADSIANDGTTLAPAGSGQIVIIGAVQLTRTTTVSLHCYGTAAVEVYKAALVATRVGRVTVSGHFSTLNF